jgi:hypothetical protein
MSAHEPGFSQNESAGAKTYQWDVLSRRAFQERDRVLIDRALDREKPADNDDIVEAGWINEVRRRGNLHAAARSNQMPGAPKNLPVRKDPT